MNVELSTIASDDDKSLVTDAIGELGDQAYGMRIQTAILKREHNPKYLPLDTLYEIIIDLIEEGVVKSQKIELDKFNGWRKLFSLTNTSTLTQGS